MYFRAYRLPIAVTMATAKATQAALFNAKFECSVCHDVFQDPRNLPCGHTFCLQCLQNIVHAAVTHNGNATVDRIPCPQCRTQFSVGSQNLQDLPKNYIVADLISSLPANSQCEQVVYCEIHPKKKSSSFARLANALRVARVLVSSVDNTLSWNCLTLTISSKLS
jgi:hypothetical protein